MTTSVLRRQVQKLREDLDTIKPQQPRKVHLLAQPAPDAAPSVRRDHEKKLADAKAAGEQVIVLVPLKPNKKREVVDGVVYVGNEAEAMIEAVAVQPSQQGKANLLADVLDGLSGNVIGPKGC